MNTTSLHIQIESDIKIKAREIAGDLGLSLSAVTEALLRQFIRTRSLSVGIEEKPNARLIRSLKQSDKDIKAGKVTSFKTGKDALSFLDLEIANEKHPQANS